jgi:Family of unknown function (DUF6069)
MSSIQVRPVVPMPRLAVRVVVAILVSVVVNYGIAWAISTLDPAGPRIGLSPVEFGPATVLGVLAGIAGWAVVRRRATRPRSVLRVLVPAVVVLSFIPDAVLVGPSSLVNMLGLWIMHVVVAVVAVTVASRAYPLT